MGLFGGNKGVYTALFYEGEVPGFASDVSCDITLDNDVLKVEQKKTKTEVTLPRVRLIGLDIFSEKDFMERYKGNSGKKSGPKKMYFVFNYMNKNNEKSQIIFWLFNVDKNVLKLAGLQKQFMKEKESHTYEL